MWRKDQTGGEVLDFIFSEEHVWYSFCHGELPPTLRTLQISLHHLHLCAHVCTCIYVSGSGKIQHFAYSIKIEILLYLASIMSELQVCLEYEHQQFYHQ